MAKHSPGPWELAEDGELISADRFTVAWVEQAEPADAALIAAAPTMAAEIAELKKRLALVGAQLRSKDAELQSKGGA